MLFKGRIFGIILEGYKAVCQSENGLEMPGEDVFKKKYAIQADGYVRKCDVHQQGSAWL